MINNLLTGGSLGQNKSFDERLKQYTKLQPLKNGQKITKKN